jgi:hypothetical protein
LAIFVFPILATDSLSQLLEPLDFDVKALGKLQFIRVVAEEDEGLQGGHRVKLLVDPPQDVVEEGLDVTRHGFIGARRTRTGCHGGSRP